MKPVWNGSEFEPRLMLPLSLSYDHRVIDGAAAARFIAHLVGVLVGPAAGAAVSELSRSASPTSGTSPTSRSSRSSSPPGDEVAAEDPLVTLESDKATMEVPAPRAGHGAAAAASRSATRSRGQRAPDARGAAADGADGGAPGRRREAAAPSAPSRARRGPPPAPTADGERDAQVVVLGAGPGGYTAAFRAADLGLKTVARRALRDARRRLPERRLHPVEGAAARRAGDRRGRGDGRATASSSASRRSTSTRCARWKEAVVGKLTGGLAGLAKQRKVEVVRGDGAASPARTSRRRSSGPRRSRSSTASSPRARRPRSLPGLPDDEPRSSTPPARWSSTTSPSACS